MEPIGNPHMDNALVTEIATRKMQDCAWNGTGLMSLENHARGEVCVCMK